MTMQEITNGLLTVKLRSKGAELASLFNHQTGLEYMWSGDPAFWDKQSPVLFPVVGTLKQNIFYANGEAYNLGRHGFARGMEFALLTSDTASAWFLLEDSAATHAVYPYPFRFEIGYSLHQATLQVTYRVINKGTGTLFFSVGGHPAFKVPLAEGLTFEDYELFFDQVENSNRWLISADGLIEKQSIPCLSNTQQLPLYKSLFYKDALVFKDIRSQQISLQSKQSPHGFHFAMNGFPYLGIWSARDADFVCIEPWCGIADAVDSNQQLAEKEGIQALAPGAVFERSWSVTTF